MKARILSKRPGFYFGYNYLNGSAAAALAQSPLELRELARGGGHIMNEYIGQAADINHPLHRWHDFAALMASDSAIVHSLGGHYFPILNYQGATLSYANAIAYACGAHPYYRHLWGAFATRYAGALWDTALMPYRNPDALLQLPATVWWRDFVHQRDVGQNHRRVLVNLIVPPRGDFVTNDKAEELPAPLDNVRVGIRAGALRPGYKLATATLLDPDNVTQTVLPIHPATAGTTGANASSTTVTVPQIRLWNVLALDFVKG
jgi:hypothetical protein